MANATTRAFLGLALASALGCVLPGAAAAATAPAAPGVIASTSTGAERFAQCFARAQEQSGRAWSFVPRAGGGGTFSNVGAEGAGAPYFLEVADRGATREIRLAPAPDRAVRAAVDRCL